MYISCYVYCIHIQKRIRIAVEFHHLAYKEPLSGFLYKGSDLENFKFAEKFLKSFCKRILLVRLEDEVRIFLGFLMSRAMKILYLTPFYYKELFSCNFKDVIVV